MGRFTVVGIKGRTVTPLPPEALGLWTTRVSAFRVNDTRPVVGTQITFEGNLEWHLWPICTWHGLDAKTVYLKRNDVVVDSGFTTEAGYFKIPYTFLETGKYLLRAEWLGDLTHKASESPPVEITVLTQEEKEKEQEAQQWWTMVIVGGVVVAGVVIGVAAYTESKRREEMMFLMAKR